MADGIIDPNFLTDNLSRGRRDAAAFDESASINSTRALQADFLYGGQARNLRQAEGDFQFGKQAQAERQGKIDFNKTVDDNNKIHNALDTYDFEQKKIALAGVNAINNEGNLLRARKGNVDAQTALTIASDPTVQIMQKSLAQKTLVNAIDTMDVSHSTAAIDLQKNGFDLSKQKVEQQQQMHALELADAAAKKDEAFAQAERNAFIVDTQTGGGTKRAELYKNLITSDPETAARNAPRIFSTLKNLQNTQGVGFTEQNELKELVNTAGYFHYNQQVGQGLKSLDSATVSGQASPDDSAFSNRLKAIGADAFDPESAKYLKEEQLPDGSGHRLTHIGTGRFVDISNDYIAKSPVAANLLQSVIGQTTHSDNDVTRRTKAVEELNAMTSNPIHETIRKDFNSTIVALGSEASSDVRLAIGAQYSKLSDDLKSMVPLYQPEYSDLNSEAPDYIKAVTDLLPGESRAEKLKKDFDTNPLLKKRFNDMIDNRDTAGLPRKVFESHITKMVNEVVAKDPEKYTLTGPDAEAGKARRVALKDKLRLTMPRIIKFPPSLLKALGRTENDTGRTDKEYWGASGLLRNVRNTVFGYSLGDNLEATPVTEQDLTGQQ